MFCFGKTAKPLDRKVHNFKPSGNSLVSIYLGKVDWRGTGHGNRNSVVVEIIWNEVKGAFSASAYVYTQRWNVIEGGQCLDRIEERHFDLGNEANALFAEVFRLWKLYHLNDMKPGTKEQMAFLESNEEYMNGHRFYETARDLLKKAGLYEVPHPTKKGETYTYGTDWITFEIPDEDKQKIRNLFKKN